MYFNKNKKPKAYEHLYKEAIQNYQTTAEIVPGSVFEGEASFTTALAITKLTKTRSEPVIQKITYENGNTYENIKLSDISFTQIEPTLFASIREKCLKFLKDRGSIKTIRNKVPGVAISNIRGNVCQDTGYPMSNFFSIYSPINYRTGYVTEREEGSYTVACEETEAENVYDYLQLIVPQMCQALYKYSIQTPNHNYIPLMDFSKKYTNQELYDLVGFTKKEIETAERVIGDYDPRVKKQMGRLKL